MIIGTRYLSGIPVYLREIYNDPKNKVPVEMRGDQCCAISI